jgi:hypothetical protein
MIHLLERSSHIGLLLLLPVRRTTPGQEHCYRNGVTPAPPTWTTPVPNARAKNRQSHDRPNQLARSAFTASARLRGIFAVAAISSTSALRRFQMVP